MKNIPPVVVSSVFRALVQPKTPTRVGIFLYLIHVATQVSLALQQLISVRAAGNQVLTYLCTTTVRCVMELTV